jgi:hypothetical protein
MVPGVVSRGAQPPLQGHSPYGVGSRQSWWRAAVLRGGGDRPESVSLRSTDQLESRLPALEASQRGDPDDGETAERQEEQGDHSDRQPRLRSDRALSPVGQL